MSGNAAGTESFAQGAVERAVNALRAGQAVVLPTDTVYGVAVLASTFGAAEVLSTLKARSPGQSLAVLVASADQARSLADRPSAAAQRLMAAFWPGPLTLVVRRRQEWRSLELGGDGSTIGVRCPHHALLHELALRLGPLVTTSANRHGQPTPVTSDAAASALVGSVGAVIDGGVLDGAPSTVVDCTTDPPHVLREGAIPVPQIMSVVESRS